MTRKMKMIISTGAIAVVGTMAAFGVSDSKTVEAPSQYKQINTQQDQNSLTSVPASTILESKESVSSYFNLLVASQSQSSVFLDNIVQKGEDVALVALSKNSSAPSSVLDHLFSESVKRSKENGTDVDILVGRGLSTNPNVSSSLFEKLTKTSDFETAKNCITSPFITAPQTDILLARFGEKLLFFSPSSANEDIKNPSLASVSPDEHKKDFSNVITKLGDPDDNPEAEEEIADTVDLYEASVTSSKTKQELIIDKGGPLEKIALASNSNIASTNVLDLQFSVINMHGHGDMTDKEYHTFLLNLLDNPSVDEETKNDILFDMENPSPDQEQWEESKEIVVDAKADREAAMLHATATIKDISKLEYLSSLHDPKVQTALAKNSASPSDSLSAGYDFMSTSYADGTLDKETFLDYQNALLDNPSTPEWILDDIGEKVEIKSALAGDDIGEREKVERSIGL